MNETTPTADDALAAWVDRIMDGECGSRGLWCGVHRQMFRLCDEDRDTIRSILIECGDARYAEGLTAGRVEGHPFANDRDLEEMIERCQDCGIVQPLIWTAPNALWVEVTGITGGSGIFCPACFDKRASQSGVGLLRWVPERIDAWKLAESQEPKQ